MIKLEKGIDIKDAALLILGILSTKGEGTIAYKGEDRKVCELILPFMKIIQRNFSEGQATDKDKFVMYAFRMVELAFNNAKDETDMENISEFVSSMTFVCETILDKAVPTTTTRATIDDDDDDDF